MNPHRDGIIIRALENRPTQFDRLGTRYDGPALLEAGPEQRREDEEHTDGGESALLAVVESAADSASPFASISS